MITSKNKTIPFPLLVFSFLIGHYPLLFVNINSFIIIFIVLLLFFISYKFKYYYLSFFIALLLGGLNAVFFVYPHLDECKLERYDFEGKIITLKGIIKKLSEKKYYQSFVLNVNSLYSDGFKYEINGKVRVKNTSEIRLSEGDEILLRGSLKKPKELTNLGGFNYGLYLKKHGIYYTVRLKKSRNIKLISKNNLTIVEKLRFDFRERIKKIFKDKDAEGFYLAVLYGDKSYLNYKLKENMAALGIMHLLAISGFHIGLLYLILNFILLRLLNFTGLSLKVDIIKLSALITISFIWLYIALTGFQISSVRAVIMITLFSLAKLFERKFNPLNILALSALVILLFIKGSFVDIGFYLSFLAVAAFLIPLKLIKKDYFQDNGILNFLYNYILINIFILLMTLPVLLFVFYKFSFGQLIFNILFIPLFSFLVYPSGLLSFVLGNEFTGNIGYKIFEYSVNFLKGDYYVLAPVNLVQLILSFMVLILILCFIKRKKIINVFLLIVLYGFVLFFPFNFKNDLNIYFMSVGEGDSALITFRGKSFLIDAGSKRNGRNGSRVILPHLDFLGIKQVDYALITHDDEDHYGGFEALLRKNRIKNLIYHGKLPKTLKKYKKVNKIILEKEKVFDFKELKIFLFPANKFKDDNNNSIITLLIYKKHKILFMADAEFEREKSFVDSHRDINNITLIKLGHHGAETSSSFQFLKAVSPKIAIISVGDSNRFGHPGFKVLKRLKKLNIKYYRTDKQGEVIVNIHKKQIKVDSLK